MLNNETAYETTDFTTFSNLLCCEKSMDGEFCTSKQEIGINN